MEARPTPSGRIRVIHLSSAHYADDARIFWKECVSLARAGYDVSYVVPDVDRTPVRGPDTGRSPAHGARLAGVDIVRVGRRNGRAARMLATTTQIVVAGLRRKGRVYHFHDPELIPAGLLLRLLGKHVIYDVHEDLPRDIMAKDWIPRRLRRTASLAAAAVEWAAGHALSGIVAATPAIARRFPADRTALVQNFADVSEAAAARRTGSDRNGVAFVGSVTAARCAVDVVEAVAKVRRFPEARLLMAGKAAPPSLIDELRRLPGWERVDYRGHLDRAGIYRLLAEARAGLALYHPHPSFAESQPVKLFEYMAAGLPVIATGFPGFRILVEGNGCGLCVPPHDVDAVAAAIEWLFGHPGDAEEMGRRGRDLVARAMNWTREEGKLLRLYERIMATG